MNGTIKKLTDKNFGFISPEDGGKDIFFHANELVGVDFMGLREGDGVSFEVKDTPKGPAATQVKKA
jgi:CspA family cold shock protein